MDSCNGFMVHYLVFGQVHYLMHMIYVFRVTPIRMGFNPRPVLVFGFCHCLCVCMCPCVCQSLACPHDNSGPVQAKISKFGPKMQRTLVKVPIVFGGNSHIRHSCAGRALLRWRKVCRRLWVQLTSAVQAPMHSVAYMYIDSYQFLPVSSSVMITCTYPFTADDNHLQKSTIVSSTRCHSTGYHDINPSFTNFVWKIIWNFCVIRWLYQVSVHNLMIHFISFEELSYIDCQNVAQYTIWTSQYILRINPLVW